VSGKVVGGELIKAVVVTIMGERGGVIGRVWGLANDECSGKGGRTLWRGNQSKKSAAGRNEVRGGERFEGRKFASQECGLKKKVLKRARQEEKCWGKNSLKGQTERAQRPPKGTGGPENGVSQDRMGNVSQEEKAWVGRTALDLTRQTRGRKPS